MKPPAFHQPSTRVQDASVRREQSVTGGDIDALFGSRLPAAQQYAELLATVGISQGLIGPREADQVWERHIINSATLSTLIPSGSVVVDLGSGAGLPGIPLSLARPDLKVVLLEPKRRRVAFLQSACVRVQLAGSTECSTGQSVKGSLQVVRGRAETIRCGSVPCVVVRAVAPLRALIPMVSPLLAPGGALYALKGREVAAEMADIRPPAGHTLSLVQADLPLGSATVVVLRRERSRDSLRGTMRRQT